MDAIDKAILNALMVNMGYRDSETVAIVMQEWHEGLRIELKPGFVRSKELCERMYSVFKQNGINVELLSYAPPEARNGIDASPEMYERISKRDIIFMPTAFSLTHTKFRKTQSEKGSRIASMPTFTLEMFEEHGPMSTDYYELDRITRLVGQDLIQGNYVRITAVETDIVVEVDKDVLHISSGLLINPGQYGNLPGAEAYVPPVHNGNTNGYITVPVGWGGPDALPYKAKFIVKNARFAEVIGENAEAQNYIDQNIKPLLFGQPDFNVVAELGIGTNPNITADYVARKGWTILTAEKIAGSAHFANGNSKAMGGKNDVPIHIDWVVPNVIIQYDYKV